MAELSTLGSVIKTAYEGEANTNAYTDAEKTKLAGVAAGATALTIGTTATTAKAGNYQPTWAQVTSKPVGVAVPDAAEGTEVATINALLASLRTAGFIAT
ncbi:hypothetical protein I6H96_11335 [Brucella anthropi]|uniref:Head fiber protein n=1 Tax=Brucella anthropi (strain ATCC 49188 / DSM 6882 / CCUG 24695 / JCM 21032 / LMG 3331 / NBRC 15819 / NCTC 12168 / Alc 37) TaxID=439375 RepID=A6WVG9_BRUA4|nr:hypothetical protein [Brucella anthropi]ABS12973.1 hypothetical protein Oant_0242 [Brucella anthropi ATCC 49188]QQC24772.1 hypothetical protein I6H96_11335 [Brucella anthropi]SUA60279.1 Uncharacterised protein [Brucella anthropi]